MLAIFVPNGEALFEDAARAGKLCELAKNNNIKRKFLKSKGINLGLFIFFPFFNRHLNYLLGFISQFRKPVLPIHLKATNVVTSFHVTI